MDNSLNDQTEKYFNCLSQKINESYKIANEARKKGLDPSNNVEVPLALTMAAKVVKLIASKYSQLDNELIINRIIELEKKYGALDNTVSFVIAEEIAKEKFCKFDTQLEAMDAGIRVGFAYTTLGVVSSPIEGYTELKTGKTKLGENYIKAFFSGPIRSAGTTATCVSVILIDYIRQLFGYVKYDPTEEECKRAVTELYDYHERITNLQYLPTENETYFLIKNCPIQITGDPTENREVSNHKNLSRIETDFIRGGFCLVVGEGLAQKAKKGLRILRSIQKNGLNINDWEWLEDYVELHEKREMGKTDDSPTYIKDLVAGRPVFGHPGKGFRFRYGRSRAAGFSAVSIHPATMAITNNFIAIGTQLKIEKPTKGCVVTSCDKIEGPIVKLKNGNVKKIKSYDEGKELYSNIEEIIYLGDILVPLGDVINRNAILICPGYVEEWWKLDLENKGYNITNEFDISFQEAVELSEKFNVSLYPNYIYYWTQINYEQFIGFIDWLNHSKVTNNKLIFPYNNSEKERFKVGKRALELLGIEHSISVENVILELNETNGLLINLGFPLNFIGEIHIDYVFKKKEELLLEGESEGEKILKIINEISKFHIKDKSGEFIGARMGRPEKAKMRKLTGSPNIIFPVGKEGGRLRSINESLEGGVINGEFPFNYCEKCAKETIYKSCENCGHETKSRYYCKLCNREVNDKCSFHQIGNSFKNKSIDINYYYDKAREKLGLLKNEMPVMIKGVRGTSSQNHDVENIVKGILRSKYNLCVNKDGTIRYDMTEIPLTHFRPKEIEVGVDKLKELGYIKDYKGNELVNENQILELKPHDILIPCNDESGDERGDDFLINVSKYIDDLLEKFYGLNRFFNIKDRTDLIGHLGVCMSPHNCAGVICRFIGFTKIQGLVASPYLHAAMRRDCDGDEAAMMLLLDVLINFSRKFLSTHRGATQDAPMVLNGKILAKEVDDQILDFELVNNYPLELYQLAENRNHSSKVDIETVKKRIAKLEDPYVNTGFTHDIENINQGAICSAYKILPSMKEKVKYQMMLCEKLRSVDHNDVARLIIERHFMKDLKGNLRKFTQQSFRCGKCNEIYRRVPLNGKCKVCNNPKLIFTISYGSIIKYLEPGLDLAKNYDVPVYIKQDLELTKKYIESIFGKDDEKQESIDKWF
ncbi:MAG: DNA polymerase II large subunit [Nanoarchaeota archaeon]